MGALGALPPRRKQNELLARVAGGLKIALLLTLFLVGVRALGDGFQLLGEGLLKDFFEATANPFVGLALGILATSIVQSSSVTTSMVVALVAAPQNPLPIDHAIPMVMGANIGTTVTNTIVAMGHVARPREFQRAIAAGTCDDFFNLVAVLILLPLELATGVLQWLSGVLVGALPKAGPDGIHNPIAAAIEGLLEPVVALIRYGFPERTSEGFVLLAFAGLVLFGTLALLVKQLRRLAGSRVQASLRRALSKTAFVGLVAGAVMTAIVQSSSLTLSVLVPFAATNIVTLEQMFPIVLGANFGTTLTALLAAMAAPAQTLASAVQIALVHMLFNLIATLLIYPFGRIRQLPLGAARWIAREAIASKFRAASYVVLLFYGLPALGYLVWRTFDLGAVS